MNDAYMYRGLAPRRFSSCHEQGRFLHGSERPFPGGLLPPNVEYLYQADVSFRTEGDESVGVARLKNLKSLVAFVKPEACARLCLVYPIHWALPKKAQRAKPDRFNARGRASRKQVICSNRLSHQ